MKTLSIFFNDENNFIKALEILKTKNFDNFLLNITINTNELQAENILFDLEFNNIKYNSAKFY